MHKTALTCLTLMLMSSPCLAMNWQSWFKTPDQQGQALMQNKQPKLAAESFDNTDWRGTAHYRAQNYLAAIDDFSKKDDATSHYNRGNALARSGKFDLAIKAYDQALKMQPNFADASFNKALLEKLKDQQKDQDQPDNQPPDNPSQDEQSEPTKTPPKDAPEPQPKEQTPKDAPEPQPKEQTPKDAPEPQPKEQTPKDSHNQDDEILDGIPDDPGSLLQKKFLRDHIRHQQEPS